MLRLENRFTVLLLTIFILMAGSGIGTAADEPIQTAGNNSTLSHYNLASTVQSSSPTITETRITTNPSESECPDIYGNKIVWEDLRNGNFDIYIFDLSTHQEISTTNKADQRYPAIYGNKLVWQDQRNGNWDIYLQDLSTKTQTRITTNASNSENPDIYGDKIVWNDDRNGGGHYQDGDLSGHPDIYMYDLSTKKETRITTTRASANPKIYANKIVWGDLRNGNWDVYMYDLSNSKETQITGYKSNQMDPEIYGNRIVWVDDRNGHIEVYMYDLSTSKETRITNSGTAWWGTPIYGDRIVWKDQRNGNGDIYMYDLSTNQETQITTSKSAHDPAIYDNKIVWADWKDGSNDIYMATIGSNLPNSDFSASTTSGNAPLTVKFTDKSTGSPTAWKWSFGDGSALVTQYNPTYTYTKPGTYTVKETVSNAAGKDTEIKTNYVTVKAAPVKAPVAAFSASPISGKVPLKVQFTDKSTNSPTSWTWSFGDGTYSTSKSPSHTYSKAGKYTVSLTVKNAKGSNTKTISGYIVTRK